jgi:hypothetical protein
MTAQSAATVLTVIDKTCGAKPKGCPWRAFEDPLVRDVLELYAAACTGQGVHLASVRLMCPSHRLWLGLCFYASAVEQCRAALRESERQRGANTGRPFRSR